MNSVNKLLTKYAQHNSNSIVSIGLFDSVLTYLYFGEKITNVNVKYNVHTGATALYDSIVISINHHMKHLNKNQKIAFIVITDGIDNMSHTTIDAARDAIAKCGNNILFIYMGTDNQQMIVSNYIGFHYNILYSQTEISIDESFRHVYNILTGHTYTSKNISCSEIDILSEQMNKIL